MNKQLFASLFTGLCWVVALVANVQAQPSNELGANRDAPAYTVEADYVAGTLGQQAQPAPADMQPDAVYGIAGSWPTYPSQLAPGEGGDKVKAYCSICHSTTYITMQPPLTADQWRATVSKMRETFGAKAYIPEKEAAIIVSYLQAHYTPKTIAASVAAISDVASPAKTTPDNAAMRAVASAKSMPTQLATLPNKALGESVFSQNCAACHQASGEGIPGAFPPLKDHAPEVYNAQGGIGGRDYLARILINGLAGKINVNGKAYNGNMPAWGDVLNDKQLAAVLNHMLTAWDNERELPQDFTPYDADDIKVARAKSLSPIDVYNLRSALSLKGQSAVTTTHQETGVLPLAKVLPDPVYVTLQNSEATQALPNEHAWPGAPGAHYDALSSDGNLLMVSSLKSNDVVTFDTHTGEVTARIDVGEPTQGIKISPDDSTAIVVQPKSGDAVFIDLQTLSVKKKIRAGDTPHNVRFSDDGKRAYITLQGDGGVAVIDMASLTKMRVINVPGLNQPHNLDISADGKRLWVRDFVGKVAIVQLSTDKVIKLIEVGKGHGGIDVIPHSHYVAAGAIADHVVSLIDANTLKVVKNVDVGPGPHGVRASKDGRWLYASVTGANAIAVIDMKSLKRVRMIPLEGKFPFWIEVRGNQ